MVLAFLTYFGFFNLQRVAEGWMEAGLTPAWLGSLWYQAVILTVVYLILLSDSYWYRRLKRRLLGPPRAGAPLPNPGPSG
jgi:lipopolysaccharide export system permease protein